MQDNNDRQDLFNSLSDTEIILNTNIMEPSLSTDSIDSVRRKFLKIIIYIV